MTEQEIENIKKHHPKSKFYIKKNGWFYRHNACGYTEHTVFAGVYSVDEAYEHAKSCRDIYVWLIDKQEHNQMIDDKIQDLKRGIIE